MLMRGRREFEADVGAHCRDYFGALCATERGIAQNRNSRRFSSLLEDAIVFIHSRKLTLLYCGGE